MVAPTPYFADRGCHVRIYEEARALITLGHDVRIVTYHIGRDIPGIPVIRIPRIPWYNKLEAGPSWHKLYLDALLLFKAFAFSLKFHPHIIHAHLHEGALIGYFLKKVRRLPLLFDYQGSLTGECVDHGFFPADSWKALLFRRMERMINNFADRIITSSTIAAQELMQNWGVETDRVIPVIDGVDTQVFTAPPIRGGLRRLQIPSDLPIVAYLGLLNSYQGTDLLLYCIAHLKKRSAQIHFLIMGFPCEHYQTQAHNMGISDMITFTGKVDYCDAPQFLSEADIAVSPKLSLTEANGKLFNYMACGLPVIAFDTPVNREVLGDTGIYSRYGDAEDMADRILALLDDKEALHDLSKMVREKAVRDHSWVSRGMALDEIYRSISMTK